MGNKTLAALSLWLFGFSAVYSQEIPIQLMLSIMQVSKVNHNVASIDDSNDTSSTRSIPEFITQSNEYIISENMEVVCY